MKHPGTTILLIVLLLPGCGGILGTGGAEVTGLSLLHDRRSSSAIMADERIEVDATMELNSHDDISAKAHFNITSYNGIVLVTGEAPNERLRNKIISIVRMIDGVRLVHDEMVIAPPSSFSSRSNDAYITTKVKNALTTIADIPGFDATRVKVITENGAVYLMGLVHKQEGDRAGEAARRVKGVTKVVKVFEYID